MRENFQVELYEDSRGSCPVQDFINKLPKKDQHKIIERVGTLVLLGYRLYENTEVVKFLKKDIRELRIGPYRILFFNIKGKFILLHAYRKKTMHLDEKEFKIAENRKKNIERGAI